MSSWMPRRKTKHGKVTSLRYKYITTLCTLVPTHHTGGALFIVFTPAPQTPWVHHCREYLLCLQSFANQSCSIDFVHLFNVVLYAASCRFCSVSNEKIFSFQFVLFFGSSHSTRRRNRSIISIGAENAINHCQGSNTFKFLISFPHPIFVFSVNSKSCTCLRNVPGMLRTNRKSRGRRENLWHELTASNSRLGFTQFIWEANNLVWSYYLTGSITVTRRSWRDWNAI